MEKLSKENALILKAEILRLSRQSMLAEYKSASLVSKLKDICPHTDTESVPVYLGMDADPNPIGNKIVCTICDSVLEHPQWKTR